MGVILEMQKEIEPLMKNGRSPAEIRRSILAEVTKLRLDCQGKIESLLSDMQRSQWQEMVGQPFVIW